jgi:hypothetical protein
VIKPIKKKEINCGRNKPVSSIIKILSPRATDNQERELNQRKTKRASCRRSTKNAFVFLGARCGEGKNSHLNYISVKYNQPHPYQLRQKR